MKGDVTLTKGGVDVVIVHEDVMSEPDVIDSYLDDGWVISSDEREPDWECVICGVGVKQDEIYCGPACEKLDTEEAESGN